MDIAIIDEINCKITIYINKSFSRNNNMEVLYKFLKTKGHDMTKERIIIGNPKIKLEIQ